MKRIHTFNFWMALILSAHAQIQQAWVVPYDGGRATGTNQAVALILDSSGNVLVAGSSTSVNGDYDYITLKYSPNGTRLWEARYQSPGAVQDQVRAMVLDKDNNVYVTGTSATVKYSSEGALLWNAPYAGRAVAVDTNGNAYVTGFSDIDYATAKISPSGSNLWTRTYDNVGRQDISQAVAVDSLGNVFVAGTEEWGCYVLNGQVFCYTRFAILKYDSNGNQLWVTNRSLGASYAGEVKGLAVDETGNVYFTGNLRGPGGKIYYTAKITSDGQFSWIQYPIPSDKGGVTSMQIEGNNIYLTGRQFWNYPEPVIYSTFKLTNGGNVAWQANYGETPGYHQANAIALDASGNVYVSGHSPGQDTSNDWATVKYDTNGVEKWVKRYDGRFHGDDQATAIAVDTNGAVYVAGFSQTSSNLIELLLIKYAELQTIQLLSNGNARLQFFGTPGRSYRFQGSSDLSNWAEVGSSIADPSGIYRLDDTNAPAYPHRFYRTASP